jgi:hypothetical protein
MNYSHTIKNSTFILHLFQFNVMVPNPNSLFFLDQNFSCCKFKDFWRNFANFFFPINLLKSPGFYTCFQVGSQKYI